MFRILNKCDLCTSKISNQISALKFCLSCALKKSYYSVLGIDSKASAKDIKSAYYKLSLQFHPDKNNGSPESVAKFREISEAYAVLGNPEKRKIYDGKGTSQSSSYDNQYYSGYYYRARNRGGPYTGKTKDFDYNEHFRKHYEESDRYRQAEYEYFKRRWEAEFHRRYPDAEDYYRKRAETKVAYEEVAYRFNQRKHQFVLFIAVWTFIILISAANTIYDPEKTRRRTVYYNIKDGDTTIEND